MDSINLNIEKGTCYGLVGPNGAGKSTLLKILSGIIKDYKGDISFNNSPTSLGYTPQDIVLEEDLTLISNLKFYGQINNIKGEKLSERISFVLKKIGLEGKEREKVKFFSGGMKRRLNIGCTLISNPEIIILDEPTVGVDPQSRRYIFKLITDLKQEGKTIIYASHYMEEIETLCDTVAFLDKGKIVDKGTVSELINRHSEPSISINAIIPEDLITSEKAIKKDKNEWIIMTTKPLEKLIEIANICKDNNIEPNQLSFVQPKLEEIFFKLTGTGLRDDS